MDNRPNLQTEFEAILGNENVYFQSPESVKMNYPAIRYKLSGYRKVYANNGAYRLLPMYEVTLIDSNPDSEYVKQLLQLPYCRFDRHYVSDNMNHFVFTLY